MTQLQTELTIPVADGTMGCYLSEQHQGQPGIILLQEIFGVNPHLRRVANRLAEAGYSVLAPDIFHRSESGVQLGYDETGFAKGFQLLKQLDRYQAVEDIRHGIKFLKQRGSRKVAVFGFCLGGFLAFLSAARLRPDAAIAYYPGGVGHYTEESQTIECPLLFQFALTDEFVPREQIEKIRLATQPLQQCKIETYDAEHGFNCEERRHYHAPTAALAWQRSLDFLQTHLS